MSYWSLCPQPLKFLDFPGGTVVKKQGIWVQSLVQENPTRAEQLSPCTTTTEPACSRACVPQLLSLRAATTEAHVPRAGASQLDKPLQ